MKNIYQFAGRNVEINALSDVVQRYCAAFCVEGKADFTVTITRSDLAYEREKEETVYGSGDDAQDHSPDERLELVAVYRKIAEKMPEYDTILFHCSAVAVDRLGYLFAAKSGTGKSTHTRLWRELLGDRVVMINDDKPLIRLTERGAFVYGTPWSGKHHLFNNIEAPIKGICFISRGEKNQIENITAEEAYPLMMQQTYLPADSFALMKTFQLIEKLADNTGLYSLSCNMDIEAAEVAYQAMKC